MKCFIGLFHIADLVIGILQILYDAFGHFFVQNRVLLFSVISLTQVFRITVAISNYLLCNFLICKLYNKLFPISGFPFIQFLTLYSCRNCSYFYHLRKDFHCELLLFTIRKLLYVFFYNYRLETSFFRIRLNLFRMS